MHGVQPWAGVRVVGSGSGYRASATSRNKGTRSARTFIDSIRLAGVLHRKQKSARVCCALCPHGPHGNHCCRGLLTDARSDPMDSCISGTVPTAMPQTRQTVTSWPQRVAGRAEYSTCIWPHDLDRVRSCVLRPLQALVHPLARACRRGGLEGHCGPRQCVNGLSHQHPFGGGTPLPGHRRLGGWMRMAGG